MQTRAQALDLFGLSPSTEGSKELMARMLDASMPRVLGRQSENVDVTDI